PRGGCRRAIRQGSTIAITIGMCFPSAGSGGIESVSASRTCDASGHCYTSGARAPLLIRPLEFPPDPPVAVQALREVSWRVDEQALPKDVRLRCEFLTTAIDEAHEQLGRFSAAEALRIVAQDLAQQSKVMIVAKQIPEAIGLLGQLFHHVRPQLFQDLELVAKILRLFAPLVQRVHGRVVQAPAKASRARP